MVMVAAGAMMMVPMGVIVVHRHFP